MSEKTAAAYPASWYPLCLSKDLKKNGLKPVQLFGTEWVLFRETNGTTGMVFRYCPHMGTDLASGCIKENCIRCPLHYWQFNTSGERIATELPSAPSKRVRTPHLSTAERYGIIFVFWGESPAFALPSLDDRVDPLCARPKVFSLENNYLAVTLNAFDTHHLSSVHRRVADTTVRPSSTSSFHLGFRTHLHIQSKKLYDALLRRIGMGAADIQYDCWGANFIVVRNFTTNYSALLMMLPGESNNESKAFLVVVGRQRPKNPFTRFIEQQRLRIQRWFAVRFLMQDVSVIKNMRPRKGALTDKDALVDAFWEYFEKLPRYSPFAKNV